jgi:hypothetical protein
MRQHVLLPLLGIVCLVGSQSAMAQGVTTSAIKGLVLDAKGEPLPGATVLAVHLPTGTKYGVSTRDNGQFDLLNLRIGGPYEITVSFVGYETFVERNVQLALGKTYETRAVLREGAGQQLGEVVISGNRDGQINPDRTGAATNIGSAAIRSLPTISRSQEDFTRLTPQASGGGLSFGGRNPLYNNFSLDGSIFNNSFGLDSPNQLAAGEPRRHRPDSGEPGAVRRAAGRLLGRWRERRDQERHQLLQGHGVHVLP